MINDNHRGPVNRNERSPVDRNERSSVNRNGRSPVDRNGRNPANRNGRNPVRRSRRSIRRRMQVRRRLIMLGVILLLIIISIVSCTQRCAKKKEEKEAVKLAEQEAKKKEEKSKEKSKEEKEEERLERVKVQAEVAGYPTEIIELLEKNPKTVDFVENYEKKKNEPAAETIGEITKGEIPYLMQWDEGWGYSSYGTSTIAVSGCGPTCLSMVVAGLTGDNTITPSVMAAYSEQYGYITEENDTAWTFMAEAAQNWGVTALEIVKDESSVAAALSGGRPVICALGPGNFTQNGHFIVITGYNNGEVTVHDPFNEENTKKTWNYGDIEDQINAIWAYAL